MGLFSNLFGKNKTSSKDQMRDINFLVAEIDRGIAEIVAGNTLAVINAPALQLRFAAETLGLEFYPVPEGPNSGGDSFALRTSEGLDIIFFDVVGFNTQVMPA